MAIFLKQRSSHVYSLISCCVFHRHAEDRSKEENMRIYKEDFVPNKLEPMMDKLNKRFEKDQYFISGKVSYHSQSAVYLLEREWLSECKYKDRNNIF